MPTKFVLTTAGLAKASLASPTGPHIEVTSFKIGSGSGYTPLPTFTQLTGIELYSGVPASIRYYDSTTIDVTCEIPASAGPWSTGRSVSTCPTEPCLL